MGKYKAKKQFDGRNVDLSDFTNNSAVYTAEFFSDLKNKLYNNLSVIGANFETGTFIKTQLVENGVVGYFGGDFYEAYPTGKNSHGFPDKAELKSSTGVSIGVKDVDYSEGESTGARLIFATPTRNPYIDFIKATTDVMGVAWASLFQNLRASMTPQFYVVDDDDVALSIDQAIQQKENGESAVVIKKSVASAMLQTIENKVPFISDKILQIFGEVKNEGLGYIGTASANSNKRERVQTGEVNANVGQTIDSIYVLIDTVNKQLQDYALPYEIELNSVAEEVFINQSTETEGEEIIKKEVNENGVY